MASDYQLPALTAANATNRVTLTPAELHLLGIQGSKVYDGTPVFDYTQLNIDPSTLFGTDSVALSGGSADVSSRHAGHYSAFVTNSLLLGGAQASNYTLTGGAVAVSITPAALSLSAIPDNRVYDGTVISTGAVSVSGLQTGDSLSGLSQVFDSKHAGSRTLSIAPSYVLNDGNGGLNYSVTLNSASGSITPATAAISAAKTYDGTPDFSASQIQISGIPGETLTLAGSGTATAHSAAVADNASNYLASLGSLVLADGSGLASDYQLPALTAANATNRVTISAVASPEPEVPPVPDVPPAPEIPPTTERCTVCLLLEAILQASHTGTSANLGLGGNPETVQSSLVAVQQIGNSLVVPATSGLIQPVSITSSQRVHANSDLSAMINLSAEMLGTFQTLLSPDQGTDQTTDDADNNE